MSGQARLSTNSLCRRHDQGTSHPALHVQVHLPKAAKDARALQMQGKALSPDAHLGDLLSLDPMAFAVKATWVISMGQYVGDALTRQCFDWEEALTALATHYDMMRRVSLGAVVVLAPWGAAAARARYPALPVHCRRGAI